MQRISFSVFVLLTCNSVLGQTTEIESDLDVIEFEIPCLNPTSLASEFYIFNSPSDMDWTLDEHRNSEPPCPSFLPSIDFTKYTVIGYVASGCKPEFKLRVNNEEKSTFCELLVIYGNCRALRYDDIWFLIPKTETESILFELMDEENWNE